MKMDIIKLRRKLKRLHRNHADLCKFRKDYNLELLGATGSKKEILENSKSCVEKQLVDLENQIAKTNNEIKSCIEDLDKNK